MERELTSSLYSGKQNRIECKQLGQTPVRQEKNLQDHIAMQYEQQSTEPALLRGPGCRLTGGARLGTSHERVQKVLKKGDAYLRLSW